MSEMVERVARAICVTHGFDPDGLTAEPVVTAYPDGGWHVAPGTKMRAAWIGWTDLARTAIQAMREPTQAMIYAFDYDNGEVGNWRAMIDEALK